MEKVSENHINFNSNTETFFVIPLHYLSSSDITPRNMFVQCLRSRAEGDDEKKLNAHLLHGVELNEIINDAET